MINVLLVYKKVFASERFYWEYLKLDGLEFTGSNETPDYS